jgi:mRNA interferase RelE/StbE
MKWTVEYSKRAASFIEEQGIEARVRDSVRDFILRVSGSSININVKKLKGEWTGYYRIRKGKIRIILRPDSETRTVFVDVVDFRGSVYR